MRRLFLFIAFLIVVPVLALAHSTTQWPLFHGDTERTGFSESGLPSAPEIKWQWTVGELKNLGITQFQTNWPVINNNEVFIAASEVMVFELDSGELVWRYKDKAADFYPRGVGVGGGQVFATVNNSGLINKMTAGFVYALNKQTGELLWKYQTREPISHSLPLAVNEKVFIGDDSATIYAINADDGSLAWQKQLEKDGDIHSSLAYADNLLFVTTEGDARHEQGQMHDNYSSLYALDPKTGNIVWQFPIDYIVGQTNLVHSTPAVAGGAVYFGVENGYFYAVSSDSGQLLWRTQLATTGTGIIGSSGGSGLGYGKVFVATWTNKFFALDQKTGKIIWEFSYEGNGSDSSPVIADNKVCFGVHDGYFYCLNADTGQEIWKEQLGGSSAALAEDVLVVTNALAAAESGHDMPVIIGFTEKPSSVSESTGNIRTSWFVYLLVAVGVGLLLYGFFSLYKAKKKG